MRPASVALLIVALALTGIGLYGIVDHVRTGSDWEAAKTEVQSGAFKDRNTVAAALKEDFDSKDRSRKAAWIFSLSCFLSGIALGTWICRTWFKAWRLSGPAIGERVRDSNETVCSICGIRLGPMERTRGLCSACRKRTVERGL